MSASWHFVCSRLIGVLVWYVCFVWAQPDFIPLSGTLPPTLSKGDAPYLVTDYLVVEQGNHTIVEKGVVFLFKNFTGITVNGSIRVEGTEEEPVVFTSENDTIYNPSSTLEPAPFDWDGISISEGEMENVFTHCIIEYSLFGIKSLSPKLTLKKCVFKDNGNADVAIEGEKLPVISPYSYAEGKALVIPDSTKTATDADQGVIQEESIPESKPELVLEEPEKERRKKREKKVSLAPAEPRKKGRAGKVLLRLSGVLAACGGGAFGVKEHLDYLDAKATFDDINEFDDEDKLKYTSEDWEREKQHANDHMTKMVVFYGIGAVGLSLFVISFTF